MNMKKISAVILALVMALSLTATAFAATDNVTIGADEATKTASQKIYGNYTVPTGKVVDAYRVDITWDAMTFTFAVDDTKTYTWDPESLQYKESGNTVTGTWTSSTNNEFKVENRSSKAVTVKAEAIPTAAATGIEAKIETKSVVNNGTVTTGDVTTGVELKDAIGATAGTNGTLPTLTGSVSLDKAPADLSKGLNNAELFTLTISLAK